MVSAIIVGTGDRGTIYASYIFVPNSNFTIVACADPNTERMKKFAHSFFLEEDQCYVSWEDIAKKDKFADAVIITLPDSLHYQAAMVFLKKGYHILLEKPITTNPEELISLLSAEKVSPGLLQICHVLRFTEFYQKVSELTSSVEFGDLVSIQMSENVGYYHYAHSFVRGNWNNTQNSGPFLLTKSCHDLDIMYWLAKSLPKSITSFGSQLYFSQTQKPENAPNRCTDGCPVEISCPYYAPRIYIDLIPLLQINREITPIIPRTIQTIALNYPTSKKYYPMSKIHDYQGWPVNAITPNPTLENKQKALETGPYGRCVYNIPEHDIVDTQVVSVEFQNGVVATFNLHGHASEEERLIRIDGTKATLTGKFSLKENKITVINRFSNNKTVYNLMNGNNGHGGGDMATIKDFVHNIETNNQHPSTNLNQSVISHFIAFAAENSRLNADVVLYDKFIESLRSI